MAFVGFGEAARLYAENAPLVDRMYDEMIGEINAFLVALRQSVAKALTESVAESKGPRSQWRVWFLPDDSTEYKSHPRVWFNDQEPEIVVPGELRLTVCVPEGKRELYAAIANEMSFPTERGDEGGLFSFDVTYNPEDALPDATARIALVLGALRAAELAQ